MYNSIKGPNLSGLHTLVPNSFYAAIMCDNRLTVRHPKALNGWS